MTAEESLSLFISFIVLVCLTINSALLVRDVNLPDDGDGVHDSPWQKWIGVKLVTLLILWGVWALFTINYIPWGSPAKDAVKATVQTVDDAITVVEDSAKSAVGL